METLKRGLGNWVDGDRFWNREAEIETFIEYLDEGANILFVAPRRIGKTSLLHEAQNRLGERYAYLIIDLEKCQGAEDMVVEMGMATRKYRSLWRRTIGVFRNTLLGVWDRMDEVAVDELTIKLRDGLTHDWQAKATRLLAELAGAELEVVVCLDEFPILLNRLLKGYDYEITPERRAEADALVSWLRAMSIEHRGVIRFVLCGSIGLEPVLRQAGLSGAVTTFTPLHLEPWDEQTSIGCLEALARSYGIKFVAGACERIVERLGCCIPHHVQLFFDLIYEDCRRRTFTMCTPEIVDRVYETRMLSSRGHAELSQLEERLMRVLGRRVMPLAIDVLCEAAVTGHLTPAAARVLARDHFEDSGKARDAIREVLGILEHDGYLIFSGDHYVFLSTLMRDWWKARFGFGFQTAGEREAETMP